MKYLKMIGLLVFLSCQCAVASLPDYVKSSFVGEEPEIKVLWVTDSLKSQASDILAEPFKGMRVRYWQGKNQDKRVWVLKAWGKGADVNAAVVVDNGKVVGIEVLEYKGLRGKEIRYPFFLKQFVGASLNDKKQLSIDFQGITGATLSANAVKKIANLALLFDSAL